jgi:hypothetical protein
MSPQQVSAPRQTQKLTAWPLVLLTSFVLVCGFGLWSSTAQAPQVEREFEDKIPKHLPLKIKLKNAEKVRSPQNENWLRDLEIEVENRSNKPIYFLLLGVILDDVTTEDGHHIGFSLQYGRGDLVDWMAPLEPDDVPIKPGESYTFKIPADDQQGWERHAARVGLQKKGVKKVRFMFKSLNFGDGTGFGTIEGVPVDIHEKPPTNACMDNGQKETLFSIRHEPPERPSDLLLQMGTLFLPAKLLAGKFFSGA